MDEKENRIRTILCELKSESVPLNFIESIEKKIEREEKRRAVIAETLQIIGVALFFVLLLGSLLYYLGVTDYDTSISDIAAKLRKSYFPEIISRVSLIFKQGSTTVWLVVVVNSLILLLLQMSLAKLYTRRLKQ